MNPPAQAQMGRPPTSFSAVPGAIGEQDVSGPTRCNRGAEDLATLPGHDKWTYGSARGILRREPEPRVPARRRRVAGPAASGSATADRYRSNVQFPVPGVPWRNANTGRRQAPEGRARIRRRAWRCGGANKPPYREIGVDAPGTMPSSSRRPGQLHRRLDAVGRQVQRPARHLYQSVRLRRSMSGWSTTTPMRSTSSHQRRQDAGADDRHAQCAGAPTARTSTGRRSCVDADGDFFVSDGYNGTRVAKFDKDGKFLLDFGKSVTPARRRAPAT